MNPPAINHNSQKLVHLKDYLEVIRSKSKNRQQTNPNSHSSPLNNTAKPQSYQSTQHLVHLEQSKNRQQTNPNSHSSPLNKTAKPQSYQSTQHLVHLEQRYLELEHKYTVLLEKVRLRNGEHQKLKEEVRMYQKMHSRDSQQIQSLRCVIGLIHRRSVETQVYQEELEWSLQTRNSRTSKVNKFDQSTQDQIKLKWSAQKFYPKERPLPKSQHNDLTFIQQALSSNQQRVKDSRSKESRLKGSRVRQSREKVLKPENSTKGLLLQYQRQLKQVASGSGKRLSNSPYSQLRFVPGFKK